MASVAPLSRTSYAAVSTRDQLIEAAERLFAENGIEGTSLRSIGVAAQQSNKVAVQYHFRDKRSLVAAIFAKRSPVIEAQIAALASESIPVVGQASLRSLVEVLCRPLVETLDGQPNLHARFLLNLLSSGTYWAVSNVSLARLLFGLAPEGDSETTKIVRLIDAQLPHVPAEVVRERVPALMRMLLGAVVNRESAAAAGHPVWPLDLLIADQLDMIATALAQPVDPVLADRLRAAL